jgi:hypothetical protein
MKITEKQLLMLVDIAKASTDRIGPWGGYSQEDRIRLVNEIINQQSNIIQDVEDHPLPGTFGFDVPQD